MKKYNDELTKNISWRVSTLKMFTRVLRRYIDLLLPHASLSNKTISEEIKKMTHLVVYIRGIMSRSFGDFDIVACAMLAKTYGKLYDALWKYYNWKKQLYEEKKRTISIESALEGDKAELDQINEILCLPEWEKFTRHKVLVGDFFGSEAPKSKDPVIQQQITISNLYGQFAGINNGQMIQNENKEVLEALTQLAKLVVENKIPDSVKSDALGDIQTIQSQVMKSNPDKTILKMAGESLGVLGNLTQIGSFVIAVQPYLNTIQNFISSLMPK